MSTIISILLIAYAFYILYKTILKKKEGKCGSCHSEHSCSKQSCSIDWDKTMSDAFPHK